MAEREAEMNDKDLEHGESKIKPEKIIPSIKWNLNDMKRAIRSVTSESFEAEFGTIN